MFVFVSVRPPAMALWQSEKTMGDEEAELISLLGGDVGHRHYPAADYAATAVNRNRTVSLNIAVENRTIVLAKEDKEHEDEKEEEVKAEDVKGWGNVYYSCLK